MARVRLSGLVRAARRAHERLRAGLPAGGAQAFLDEIADTLAQAESLCLEQGGTPDDLPAQSRRAFADLRRIATLSPEALSAEQEGTAPRQTLRISNVVSTLDRVQIALATPTLDDEESPEGEPLALGIARPCVEAVRRICANHGTNPAALPRRTGEAYALLAWLLEPGHFEIYGTQRDLASEVLGRDAPREGAQERRLEVRFVTGRRVYAVRRYEDVLDVRLNVGWLAADLDALVALADRLWAGRRASPEVIARFRDVVDSEDFGAVQHEIDALRGDEGSRAAGRVHDLDSLFAGLNTRFFSGRLARPDLRWHVGSSERRFGCYVGSLDRVLLDVRLDDERVPAFVAEFVLFHELLHKEHGATQRGRKRHFHTPAFRADEQRHPRKAEAEAWLEALAAGRSAPRP